MKELKRIALVFALMLCGAVFSTLLLKFIFAPIYWSEWLSLLLGVIWSLACILYAIYEVDGYYKPQHFVVRMIQGVIAPFILGAELKKMIKSWFPSFVKWFGGLKV